MTRLRPFCFPVLSVLFTVLLLLYGYNRHHGKVVQTQTVRVDSLEQVEALHHKLVKPLLYTNVSGLDKLPTPKAKQKFIAAVLPSILVAKHQVEESRKLMVSLREKSTWTERDSILYHDMTNRYRAKNIDDLISRMRTLPNSIVLAQTAVETGWGQSRFFLNGSNLFGIWSFNPDEPRMAAAKTRGKKMIYLRWYPDMSQSIVHYFEILSRSQAYRGLRKARLNTDNPFKLLPHLKNFSERRTAYTRQLKAMILANNLTQYDLYEIDPVYIVDGVINP